MELNEKQKKVKKLINVLFDKFEQDIIDSMKKGYTSVNNGTLIEYYKTKRKQILNDLKLDD